MSFFRKKNKPNEINQQINQFIKWFEIPANDFDRAVSFYVKVFGLHIEGLEINQIKHGMFVLNDGMVKGAIVDYGDTELKSGPVLFFDGYPSISELEKRIVENGGEIIRSKALIKNQLDKGDSILPKNFINGRQTAYFAYFLDSEGNKMGLFGSS